MDRWNRCHLADYRHWFASSLIRLSAVVAAASIPFSLFYYRKSAREWCQWRSWMRKWTHSPPYPPPQPPPQPLQKVNTEKKKKKLTLKIEAQFSFLFHLQTTKKMRACHSWIRPYRFNKRRYSSGTLHLICICTWLRNLIWAHLLTHSTPRYTLDSRSLPSAKLVNVDSFDTSRPNNTAISKSAPIYRYKYINIFIFTCVNQYISPAYCFNQTKKKKKKKKKKKIACQRQLPPNKRSIVEGNDGGSGRRRADSRRGADSPRGADGRRCAPAAPGNEGDGCGRALTCCWRRWRSTSSWASCSSWKTKSLAVSMSSGSSFMAPIRSSRSALTVDDGARSFLLASSLGFWSWSPSSSSAALRSFF